MDFLQGAGKMLKICLVTLIALFLTAPMTASIAEESFHLVKHSHSGIEHRLKGLRHRGGGDHGNETTGQLAVWLLIAVNLTVITSVLIKGANRLLPLREETKKSLAGVNKTQKKYLMRFHYFLNPAILAIALFHWSLSRCRTTSLPEWGLLMMLILGGLVFF
jgi:hypothetical protein